MKAGLRWIVPLAFLSGTVSLTANEPFLGKPTSQWTEAEALQVLNDSLWAHRVEATVQSTPCDHQHPAFAGMYPEGVAQSLDLSSAPRAPGRVEPEKAEYVVRLNSVKPMQAFGLAASRRISRTGTTTPLTCSRSR